MTQEMRSRIKSRRRKEDIFMAICETIGTILSSVGIIIVTAFAGSMMIEPLRFISDLAIIAHVIICIEMIILEWRMI